MVGTHSIWKQQTELVFNSQKTAEEQWESVMDFQKYEGLQVIAEVFDTLAPADVWIRIHSLQIDLGKLSSQNFRAEYLETLRSNLHSALSTAIGNEKQAVTANSTEAWESIIIHYLQFGTVLWEAAMHSSSSIPDSQPFRNILEEKIIERVIASDHFQKMLGAVLLKNSIAMQRWIRQISAATHNRIKNILLSQLAGPSRSILESCSILTETTITDKGISTGIQYEEVQTIKWRLFFSDASLLRAIIKRLVMEQVGQTELRESVMIIIDKSTEPELSVVLRSLTGYPEFFNRGYNQLLSIPPSLREILNRAFATIGINSKHSDTRELKALFTQSKKNIYPASSVNSDENFSGVTPGTADDDVHKENNDEFTSVSKISSLKENEEIYIGNAGLVLLAPFIESFFVQAGINTTNNLQNDEDASLGIQLLQLLVSNTWDDEEHLLVFNKVLCGRSPDWAGYRINTIPDHARMECMELLQSVIHHWRVLKNTSVEGLQETFLKRQGKLLYKDDLWQLYVDYKTTDILLESLPWSFSVIKFPWMQRAVYVDW